MKIKNPKIKFTIQNVTDMGGSGGTLEISGWLSQDDHIIYATSIYNYEENGECTCECVAIHDSNGYNVWVTPESGYTVDVNSDSLDNVTVQNGLFIITDETKDGSVEISMNEDDGGGR